MGHIPPKPEKNGGVRDVHSPAVGGYLVADNNAQKLAGICIKKTAARPAGDRALPRVLDTAGDSQEDRGDLDGALGHPVVAD
jgi:hypothetical protein